MYYEFYQQEVELKEAAWRKVVLRVLPASGGARGELLGYAGGQCHLHGGGVVVDEVAGGLHGHPAVKIRPSFGQLVDVQQCLQWEDTFWTSWARSPGSCGGCSSLPSCWDTTANGGRSFKTKTWTIAKYYVGFNNLYLCVFHFLVLGK